MTPGAEGGAEVETVTDCGSVTTIKMITSEVPEVVSPAIASDVPEDQVPDLSGPLPESKAGLEPIMTF